MADIDLALGTNRDISLDGYDLKINAGIDLITQRILIGLRLFYGEWFYTPDEGMPYYRDVLVNAPKTTMIEALFRRSILADSDILSLTEFSMTTDRNIRRINVQFTGVSSQGNIVAKDILP